MTRMEIGHVSQIVLQALLGDGAFGKFGGTL
jgi:hypothetical protein